MPSAEEHWRAAEAAAEGRNQNYREVAQGFLHLGLALGSGWLSTQGSKNFWRGLENRVPAEPTEARMCEATNHEGKRCRRVIHDSALSHETAGGYSWYSPTEG